jgi:signal transduction histidine kinase
LLNYLGQLVDFDAGSVLLVENTNQLVRRATRPGPPQPETGDAVLTERWAASAHPILQDILNTGQSQRLADLPAGAAPAWMPDAEHTRSWLGVPLALDGQVVGLCSLSKAVPDFFTAGHQRLAEGVGAQATAAIQNARLFEQVRTGQEQLRRLTQQVVLAQEQERQRVSRELHDEANQALVALMLNLDIVREELPDDSPTAQSLARAITQIDTTLQHIRLLAQDLRPPALETIGLRAVLEDYCLDFAARAKLNISYTSADLPELTDATSICLYRILQEALTNAAKHARPQHILVSLRACPGAVELCIEDDGRGFDPAADIHARGAGLLGIRERLALLNGHLELDSHPEQGTRLLARVPH